MNQSTLLPLAILAVALLSISANAQVRVDALAGAGYEHALIDGDFSEFRSYRWYTKSRGDAVSAAWGIWLPGVLGGDFGLLGRFGFARMKTEFTYVLPEAMVLLPGTSTIVTVSPVYHFPVTLTSYELELLGTSTVIVPWLSVGVGGSVGYRRATDFESTQRLDNDTLNMRWTNPDSLPSRDDGRTLVLDTGSLATNALSAAVLFSVFGEIPITTEIAIVPELRARFDLTSPFEGAGWSRIGFGGALSLRVSFGSPPGTDQSVGAFDGTPPASLRLHAVADNGERRERLGVRPAVSEISRSTPLLPVASAKTSASRLRSPSSATDARAMLDSLLRHDAPALHADAIGLLGLVLQAHPEARVRLRTLTGASARSVPAPTMRVRDEISSRFAIEQNRIAVDEAPSELVATDGSRLDAVAVDIEPRDLAMLHTVWMERSFVADALAVEPEAAGTAWHVVLLRGGHAFDTLRADDVSAHGVRPRIPFNRDAIQPPIVARLVTSDGVVAVDTLAIELLADEIRSRRTVIDLPGARERRGSRLELGAVAASIRDGDRVSVIGPEFAAVAGEILTSIGARRVDVDARDVPVASAATLEELLHRERTRIIIEAPHSSDQP